MLEDGYQSPDELPADRWQPSDHVLLLQEFPTERPELARVQLFIHSWDAQQGRFADKPIAFTQNAVNPRRIVGGSLFVSRSKKPDAVNQHGDPVATLTPGKYLIKVYVDTRGRLADDPTVLLDERDYVGQLKVDAEWGAGWPNAQRISAATLKRQ